MQLLKNIKLAKSIPELTKSIKDYVENMEKDKIADIATLSKQLSRQLAIMEIIKKLIRTNFLSEQGLELVLNTGYTQFKKKENYLLMEKLKQDENKKFINSKKTKRNSMVGFRKPTS